MLLVPLYSLSYYSRRATLRRLLQGQCRSSRDERKNGQPDASIWRHHSTNPKPSFAAGDSALFPCRKRQGTNSSLLSLLSCCCFVNLPLTCPLHLFFSSIEATSRRSRKHSESSRYLCNLLASLHATETECTGTTIRWKVPTMFKRGRRQSRRSDALTKDGS